MDTVVGPSTKGRNPGAALADLGQTARPLGAEAASFGSGLAHIGPGATAEQIRPKFQYSKNNHYRWGWGSGDDWYNLPDLNKRYKVSFGRLTRRPRSFRQECIVAARELADQFTKPLYIGLSGGLDSQVACLAFREAGIEFTPAIVKMSDGLNAHDIAGAHAFCRKFRLVPMIFELDVHDFYSRGIEKYVKAFGLTNTLTVVQLWLSERVEGAFVMAGGDFTLSRVWSANEGMRLGTLGHAEYPTPILEYLMRTGREGCTKFFCWSPELIYSYLDDPVVRSFRAMQSAIFGSEIMPKKEYAKYWIQVVKPLFYHRNWPELIPRTKYTGFENLKEFNDRAYERFVVPQWGRLNDHRVVRFDIERLMRYMAQPGPPEVWYSYSRYNNR